MATQKFECRPLDSADEGIWGSATQPHSQRVFENGFLTSQHSPGSGARVLEVTGIATAVEM